jgi:MerR family transcriptional regulator, thiopeptide resistance regulator
LSALSPPWRLHAARCITTTNSACSRRSHGPIGTLLDGEPDPTGLLRRQLEIVEERIRKAADLRARLLDVLNSLSRNTEPSAGQLLHLIERIVAMNEPMTPQQFAELKAELQRHVPDISGEDLAALSQRRDEASNTLSTQEQQHLTQQLRMTVPRPDGAL